MNLIEQINKLPQQIRDYIHDLESISPADLVQENAFLKESLWALLRKDENKMGGTITQECKCCNFEDDCIEGLCSNCRTYNDNLQKQADFLTLGLLQKKNKNTKLLEACKELLSDWWCARSSCQDPECRSCKNAKADKLRHEAIIAEAEKGA